jgi:hypothetical protein
VSNTGPQELNATAIISLIGSGSYPRDVLLTFARGFLPLEQAEVIAVLACLNGSDDPEIAAAAHETLSDTPSRVIVDFASSEAAPPAQLEMLALASADNIVLESLVRNRTFPDSAVAELARRAEPHVQDIIVTNQSRIIRAPGILDALLENPRLTNDARRRALEVREEFFDKKARLLASLKDMPLEASEEEAPFEAIVDLLEKAESEPQPPHTAAELMEIEKGDPDKMSIWSKVQLMTVGQKVLLAFRGDKTTRSILVRERNKLVCSSAMRNPRMSDTEAENIAGMRSVDEEVLRLISLRRDWMSKYPIIIALARNPRAPVGVVLPLINRLALRDLKSLKDDKGVSEVARTTARKLYAMRKKND